MIALRDTRISILAIIGYLFYGGIYVVAKLVFLVKMILASYVSLNRSKMVKINLTRNLMYKIIFSLLKLS